MLTFPVTILFNNADIEELFSVAVEAMKPSHFRVYQHMRGEMPRAEQFEQLAECVNHGGIVQISEVNSDGQYVWHNITTQRLALALQDFYAFNDTAPLGVCCLKPEQVADIFTAAMTLPVKDELTF